jgi:hypothetical protein
MLPETTTGQLGEDFREVIPTIGVADSNQSPAAVSASPVSGRYQTIKFSIAGRYYSPLTSTLDGEKLMVKLIDDNIRKTSVKGNCLPILRICGLMRACMSARSRVCLVKMNFVVFVLVQSLQVLS